MNASILSRLILALLILGGCAGERPPLPDSPADTSRIADGYPGDQGIGQDSRVLFAEDFEQAPLADIMSRFTFQKHPASVSLVDDYPPLSSGRWALRITSIGEQSTGGTLYKRLDGNFDRLYLRYYIKYPSGGTFHHSSAWLGGYQPPTDWPQGKAGLLPRGDDRFSIAVEPVDAQDRIDFYTYWMGMQGGPTGYWGNHLIQDPSVTFTRDRWTCVEIMAKMNDPVTASNGELALWLDGVPVKHVRMFQWRNDPALALNWFWLQHYATQDPAGFIGHVLFDHVVLATDRVGCLATAPK